MKYILSVVLLIVICSCYYFPFTLVTFPIANSKMITAAVGLALFVWEHVRQRSPVIRNYMFFVVCLGVLFSLWCLFSVAYNSTDDMVYATYFVSMSVWLGGAYCVVWLLRRMYGTVSLDLIFMYLGLMCAAQCVLAVLIDNIPALRNVVDSLLGIDAEYFEKNPRLYGFGAAFDSAGIRFSAVLVGLAYLARNSTTRTGRVLGIILFLIIGAVGNMISRTTIVGLVIGFAYWLPSSFGWIKAKITSKGLLWFVGGSLALVACCFLVMHAYRTMPNVRGTIDYGFEGFINWYHTGSFSTHSSDLLLEYIWVIWPDNLKTWLIGDGYFADPYDPEKFYMGTDMGYVRLIFYCGAVGLAIFIIYFLYCTYCLYRRDRSLWLLFIYVFTVQLVVWVKIPTDIFCFYALLLLSDGARPEGKQLISDKYLGV